jgi:predicted RNase H-like nuclease (RuvC/YqgF family)
LAKQQQQQQQQSDPMNEDDCLYDDLDVVDTSNKSQAKIPTTTTTKKNAYPKSFAEQVEELQSHATVLQEENENLKRNIGTLFRTAKAEVQRKNDQIARLQAQLDDAQQQQQQLNKPNSAR